jgi:hypothetical protein
MWKSINVKVYYESFCLARFQSDRYLLVHYPRDYCRELARIIQYYQLRQSLCASGQFGPTSIDGTCSWPHQASVTKPWRARFFTRCGVVCIAVPETIHCLLSFEISVMRSFNRIVFFLIANTILLASPVQAETVTSTYTNFDLTKCKVLNKSEEDGGGQWICKGIKGYDVLYSDGDLRGTMAFGRSAEIQCAAAQSFGRFNSPGDKIEWRMIRGKPIATILRWFTDNGEPDGKQNWLVVTKINSDEVCRTAIIDTKYPNANKVAQLKADASDHFSCTKDLPELISAKPSKVEDIMSGVPCSPP